MQKRLSSKSLTFSAMMAALGNVLSFLSMQLAPIAPNIPLGPVTISLALDLSHLSTFIAAFFGGPFVGAFTGLLGGLVGAFEFGFSKGNLVTGFGLPIGKALTGYAAGIIFSRDRANEGTVKIIFTVLSYIPEAIFTWILFVFLFPIYLGLPSSIASLIAYQILAKAFFEMILMGFLLNVILKNQGFTNYVQGYFS